VKPLIFANMHEVNIEDYIRNLRSFLDQVFKPMNISLIKQKVTLAEKRTVGEPFYEFSVLYLRGTLWIRLRIKVWVKLSGKESFSERLAK